MGAGSRTLIHDRLCQPAEPDRRREKQTERQECGRFQWPTPDRGVEKPATLLFARQVTTSQRNGLSTVPSRRGQIRCWAEGLAPTARNFKRAAGTRLN